jgi:CubicO group peptidase (beta-lactamase class C family)
MIAPILLLALLPAAQAEPFPAATPESQGLDPKALAALADTVRGFVEHDEVVGAELLVIKGGHTVLHDAFGWKDREQKAPMVRDTLFCVRSMTKPVAGTAVEMLIEEGKLKLDDPVARYLPSFDTDKARAITIAQLLHHTAASGCRACSAATCRS